MRALLIVFCAAVIGALAGVALVFLAACFGGDKLADF